MKLIAPWCFALIFFACSSGGQVPRGILEPKIMQGVVFDLLRADEFVINYVAKDSTIDRKTETIKLYEQVFKIHGITKDEFFKSYKYYQEHPNKNKILFDSLHNSSMRKINEPFIEKPVKLEEKLKLNE